MTPLRLLGPFPPPYGGVALHMVRLLEALKGKGLSVMGVSQAGVPKGIADVRRFGVVDLVRRAPVHYHTDEGNARWMMLFGAVWRIFGVPYVVTVHSFRDRPELHRSRWKQQLRSAFHGARAIIAISGDVRTDLVNRLDLDPSTITVIGSDLPISMWERRAPLSSAFPEAWRTAPVRILANAGRLVRYQGHDLYGMDLLAEATNKLGSDVATALVIGEVIHPELLTALEEATARNPHLFLIRVHEGPLLPAVEHAHIIVRPTRTEGGRSLTLTEAIELGRWAVGSDAVLRPLHTRTFPNGSAMALHDVLSEVCHHVRSGVLPEPVMPTTGLVEELLEVYRRSFS